MNEIARLRPYLAGLLAVAATLLVVGAIHLRANLPTTLLLYLVPVVLTATRWGRGPAIVAVVASVVGHDFLFVDPVGTLTVAQPDELIGLILLLFTAVVTAQLASQARRASEKEREAAVARRSDELKTALLHAVSHNLRTPLASIKAGASGLLQAETTYSEEDRRELLEAIEEEADRLDRLVSNMLDASRIEAGTLHPHRTPQDLGELVRTVVGRLGHVLDGRPVEVCVPENLPLVRCDYAQVDQVLTNLLENVARHTPPRTPIAVTVEADDREARVSVADRGPGIPAHERERLFRPFERGKTRAPGSGLGLAIARGLVEAHGGRLWAEEVDGGGALFTFTLPIEQKM